MEYKAISAIQLQQIAQAVRDKYNLVIPTYTVKLPGGGEQTYPHDKKSIFDSQTPQAEQAAWLEYQEQLELLQAEINEKSTAYMFYKGVDCEIDDEWIAEQEWLGITLPENKRDLKIRYITTELLKTPFDIQKAIAEIMQLSMKGADPSKVKAAEDMFSGSLQT